MKGLVAGGLAALDSHRRSIAPVKHRKAGRLAIPYHLFLFTIYQVAYLLSLY
jgi:hypothetical protein